MNDSIIINYSKAQIREKIRTMDDFRKMSEFEMELIAAEIIRGPVSSGIYFYFESFHVIDSVEFISMLSGHMKRQI